MPLDCTKDQAGDIVKSGLMERIEALWTNAC